MKNALVILLLGCVLGPLALADTSTYFDKILSYYKSSKMPQFSELRSDSDWQGNCATYSDPNTLKNDVHLVFVNNTDPVLGGGWFAYDFDMASVQDWGVLDDLDLAHDLIKKDPGAFTWLAPSSQYDALMASTNRKICGGGAAHAPTCVGSHQIFLRVNQTENGEKVFSLFDTLSSGGGSMVCYFAEHLP